MALSAGPALAKAADSTDGRHVHTASPIACNNPLGNTSRRFRHRGEHARDRDVFRHLCTWERVFAPGVRRRNAFPTGQPTPAPYLCPDKTLTALAQLLALRMSARTCIVSLCCRDTEYVLADVTQRTPFQSKDAASTQGLAWIGTSSFDRSCGLTARAIDEWQKAKSPRTIPREADYYYTQQLSQHCFIISDVRHDSRSQKVELVQRGPWIRFYCSVPIRSGQGSVIGSLTVLDDRPRYGISCDELTLMEDVSDTVVEHLHSTVVRSQQQRSERLLQGLSLFNAGGNSMRDWWLSQDDAKMFSKGRNTDNETSADRSNRADREFGVQTVLHSTSDECQAVLGHTPSADRLNLPVRPVSISAAPPLAKDQIAANAAPAQYVQPSKRRGHLQTAMAMSIPAAYARAANLVREALEVDGVVFINLDTSTDRIERTHLRGGTPSPSESGDSLKGIDNARPCEIHSLSTRPSSATGDHTSQSNTFEFSDTRLRRLTKRYPQGQVFHFEQDGSVQISSSDESDQSGANDEQSRQKRRVQRDMEALGRAVPEIHSAGLYPLWDDGHGRWRSSIFVWSTSYTRILDSHEDLAYLRTFGHSFLAEISRLESIAADQAKSTFISQISHELRSPLHGILAGVEFLHSTDLNAFQLEMADTIDVAGRTLLDTVDHILDYSKLGSISRASRAPKDDTGSFAVSPTSVLEDRQAPVSDLAQLTENVVETCVSAYRLQLQSKKPSQSSVEGNIRELTNPHTRQLASTLKVDSDVAITLTIGHRKSWVAEVQPGAWTRILTNIVGNALKYTRKGHVSVRLDASNFSRKTDEDNGDDEGYVSLIVEDTGIGMSNTFLTDSVFVPFKQEDPYSAGIGLGLSIVKQIADDMGAKLSLDTKLGKGTTVSLRVPVKFLQDKSPAGSRNTLDEAKDIVARTMKADLFHLLSSSTMADISCVESAEDATELTIGKSVMDNAEEWLGCHASIAGSIERRPASTETCICAVTEKVLKIWKDRGPQDLSRLFDKIARNYSHILVLAETIGSVMPDPAFANSPLKQVFVHQPIGPAKLLRAIAYDRDSTMISQTSSLERSLSIPPPSPLHQGVRRQLRQGVLSLSEARNETNHDRTFAREDSSATLSSSDRPTQSSIVASISSTEATSFPSSDEDTRERNERDTVLLVEDNDINMKLLIALVTKLNFPFQCAANGREALTLYRKCPQSFFLILMDINMPVMDGFTATAKIREREEKYGLPRTYITALTGVTDSQSKGKAFKCGVDDFYSKPVRMRELKEILEKLNPNS